MRKFGNYFKKEKCKKAFPLALTGDSRDGDKVYARLIGSVLERKPHFFIHRET